MAIHSSILTWRIPWTEEAGGLQFIGSQRVRHRGAERGGAFKWQRQRVCMHVCIPHVHGCERAHAPVSDFSRGTTGSSESLSCGARDVRSPCPDTRLGEVS